MVKTDPWNNNYENPMCFLAGVYVHCETSISRIEKMCIIDIENDVKWQLLDDSE